VLTRIDQAVNFDWGTGSPGPGVPPDEFSARWTGKLVPAVSGKYHFGAIADDGVRIFLDGKLIAEDWTDHAPATVTGEVSLQAGKTYDLKFEYYEGKIGAVAKLVWQPPGVNTESSYAEAVKAAKQADAVVMVLGLSSQLEGEEMNVREPGFLGGDRTDIGLPERQQKLLEAVAATGKPIVLVLMNGSALAVNWPTNTCRRLSKPGTRVKKVARRSPMFCSAITIRPAVCRSLSINQSISCRRSRITACRVGRIAISRASPSTPLALASATRNSSTTI
jgi:hypothetical protein